LRLEVGGRLSNDVKRAVHNKIDTGPIAAFAPNGTTTGKINDTTLDASATLSYNLSPSSVAYATIGRGNKTGAFNNNALTLASQPNPFIVPTERATSFEAGVKGRFWGGRAYASLALYHVDIKGYQDSFYSAPARGFIIRSIDAKSTGAEVEGRLQATPWLNLFGNLAYAPTVKLATGERAQRAPKFTYTLGTRVSTPLNQSLQLDASAQLVHSSPFYNQPPTAPGHNSSGSYDLVGARLAVTYIPLNVEFSVTGANLTNSKYRPFTFGSPFGGDMTVGTFNRPRTITLGAKVRF